MSTLPPLTPDAARARRVRSRCLARFERDRRRSARLATTAAFGRRVVAPAVAAALCAAYALALVDTALRTLSRMI
jgi:hypothetical protein